MLVSMKHAASTAVARVKRFAVPRTLTRPDPLPPPPMDGSIYERQSFLENRYFEVYGEKASEAAAE